MSRAVRCLRCDVWLVPFGQSDLGSLVIDHLRSVHGQPPALHAFAHPSNPAWIPEPVA